MRRVAVGAGGRVVVVGDIHGCFEELCALLEIVRPAEKDVVISTGDMVRKGPRPDLCLKLWRDRGYLAVTGNNEEKVVGFAERNALRRLFLPREDRIVVRRQDLVDYMRSLPVVIDIPSRNLAIVHGGLLPGMKLTEENVAAKRHKLIRLRDWAKEWGGPRTVVYGHTPLRSPRVDAHAVGLDTGCVYGGELTAAIFEPDGPPRFERVKARRAYAR